MPMEQWSFVIVFVLGLYSSCTANHPQLSTHNKLTNIVIDQETGSIYLGGVNFLIKTRTDLAITANVTTGPENDNDGCLPVPFNCDKPRVPTDNRNKILVIQYSQRYLVTCGSVYHGRCQLRNLDTLAVVHKSQVVVASHMLKPAVGVIAKGPCITSPDGQDACDDVLYIGTSWTQNDGDTYSTSAALSSRRLNPQPLKSLFAFAARVRGTKLQFNDYNFEVHHIYGFSSGDVSYFVMVQETLASYTQKLTPKRYETKIARVCHDDKSYATYAEIPLTCTSHTGGIYTVATSATIAKPGSDLATNFGISTSSDVLFVSFTNDTSSNVASGKHSAMCFFTVKNINKGFEFNIKKCSKGGDIPLGMPWAKNGGGKCKAEPYSSLCNPYTNNWPISGSTNVSSVPMLEWNNKKVLTSVVALPYEVHTAVILGTQDGRLLKVSIGKGSDAVKPYYDKPIAAGQAINRLVLSKDNQSVYAATDFKVIKVPVEECSSFTTCQTCSGRGDPFCGWCTLYRKCSRRLYCANAGLHALRFATTDSKCTRIVSTKPERFPFGAVTELNATIENLPPLQVGDTYRCYINDKLQPTMPISSNTVQCSTPPKKDLPPITSSTGDVLVELALYSSETGKKFVTKKIPFYDCTKMKGCMTCAQSVYDCDWCTYSGQCSADGNNVCPGEVILSKGKRLSGAVGCPELLANQTFYVPNDVSTPVVVKAKDLPPTKTNYVYECEVKVDGKKVKVDASRDSSTQLTCKAGKYAYNALTETALANLNVIWRGADVIYKPNSVKVKLYKCDVSNTDCGTCLNANPHFSCGWCKDGGGKCLVRKACSSKNWVHPASPCLIKPIIEMFWPLAGAPVGGTELEINGREFGKEFSDIENSVFVDNYRCIPDPAKYIVSKRIVCNTTRSPREFRGPVRVTVNNLQSSSKTLFSYQTPVLTDFYPKKGPQSGGTPMNITGVKLNTGRRILAWVGGAPCIVDRARVTDTSIPCVSEPASTRTRRAAVHSSGAVQVSFDGYRPLSPPGEFTFTADPVVTSIRPRRTFPGGGLRLTVTGQYFDSVQTPKMYYTIAGMESEPEVCQILSSTSMICPSPNVSKYDIVPGSMNGSELIAGFIMDQVPGLDNVTTLAIIKSPYFLPFDDGENELKTDSLIIKGENLDILTKDDVSVSVEGIPCNLTGLDETQLVCTVPKQDSLPVVQEELYTVIVSAGYLKFNLGKLKYFKSPPPPKSYMTYIYIGVAAGGFVLLVVILCLVCAYRRRKRHEKRNVKKMEVQMDALESKVAKECREAFAELQTDMTDLMGDLTATGMPFLEFRTYALHVLFPGVTDHPVLQQKDTSMSLGWERALRKFAQLIYQKDFLLIFIRTVESQMSFSMKDRCNLASLLMVALQGRMEYATEILWNLLCELIRKSVAKNHPKLLLRRTESVAEKLLTNWLAFCMYNHLKTESGEPLFMMYKSIKRQVGKGPVDGVTGEARYSLSEDKLLRQTIDYEEIPVTVVYEDNPPAPVTLLDCDTISQAKSKILDTIYKNIPFSARTDADTLQLEWNQSDGSVKPLRDDDSSSVVEGPWRRINTLGHFKVPAGAALKLSPRQSYFYSSNDSGFHHRSLPKVAFSPFSYTPISRGSKEDLDEVGRTWHLVKQLDYPTENDDRKMLAEIYLTRLLATKGTLQQFVDGLFNSMFSNTHRGARCPMTIKYLFDLLDSQAEELNLSDAEVLHTWKNNSLPLRFWINIIKNPNFIFDIDKSGIVDSCLSVIAQLFMDACSISDHRLGIHSPSNKLLYAKEIPAYKERVESFYSEIRSMPSPSNDEVKDFFADLSMQYSQEFNSDNALKELIGYVTRYQDQLQEKLEESGYSSLASKLEHIIADTEND